MVIAMKNRMEQINMLLEQDGMEVSLQERFKNNQLKQGMVLRSKEFNCSPVIYVDEKFWELSDLEIAEQLKQSFEKYSFNMEPSAFLNKEYVLQNVLPRVYSEENIPAMEKEGITYLHKMDLAFAFYIPLNMNMNARELSSVTLTNALLDNLEISMDELVEAAEENIVEECNVLDMPFVMKGLGFNITVSEDTCPTMVVISNKSQINGAGVMFNENTFQPVSEFWGNSFAILPSSIHECICVPFSSEQDLQAFQEMVCAINKTTVPAEDKLTDSVYVWDNGRLSQFSK